MLVALFTVGVYNVRFVSGSLHFANVETGDAHGGQFYGCVLYNSKFRGYVQGNDQRISPVTQAGNS